MSGKFYIEVDLPNGTVEKTDQTWLEVLQTLSGLRDVQAVTIERNIESAVVDDLEDLIV